MDKILHHQKAIVHIPSRSLFNIVVDKTPKNKKKLNDQNPAPPRGSQQQHWIGGSGVAIVWLEKIDVG